MSSVIIAIVVVLGIIVAGGFLLYFLGDLLMSISGKKKDADAIREKQLKEQKELEDRVSALENSQEVKNDPAIATVLLNGGTVEAYNPDEDEEEKPEETVEVEEDNVQEVQEEGIEDAEEQTEEDDATEEDATAEYIRQRRQELLERLARMQEEREETEEEEEDSVDLTEESEAEEQAEEIADADENEEAAAEEESVEEQTEDETEGEETETTVEEVVAEQVVEQVAQQTGVASNFTLEELETKLAEAQDKLKANEKELRKCKKEYIPLRRVKKTLESDENKLRRKEALVAKQKVVLYGVNNYADIDEEKAQKLAEDLDLLDGLKLSVQHCQEVMDKNQDRYPLLEQIFNLLSSQNEQIKADIKQLQEAIAALKSDNED